jgi:hypothetical protein
MISVEKMTDDEIRTEFDDLEARWVNDEVPYEAIARMELLAQTLVRRTPFGSTEEQGVDEKGKLSAAAVSEIKARTGDDLTYLADSVFEAWRAGVAEAEDVLRVMQAVIAVKSI